jgi:hypothetical protein
MRPSTRKLLLPSALATLGVWALVGCVYIPAFGPTVTGKNASESVGYKDSRKPVRTNASSLDDVIRILGEPQAATADRRVLAYTWVVRNGYSIWPLCFAGYAVNGKRTLVLRFDGRDVLKSFEVLKLNDPVIRINGVGGRFAMPVEIEQERIAEGRRIMEQRRSATRPTTTPATAPAVQPE